MAHPFVKAYVSVCNELLLPLGFKRKGRYFCRIVNDVYQDMDLKLYRDGQTYSVFFGFIPFCCGFEGCYSFYLENAALILYRGETESECRKNAEQLGNVILEHTIPLYERVTDTASAFAEWHRIRLMQESESNLRYPSHLFSVFPDYLVSEPQIWMAMALGNDKFAVSGLRQLIDIEKYTYKNAMRSLGLGWTPESFTEAHQQTLREYEEKIERIQVRDMDWINGFIAANERKSRIALGLEKE